MVDLEEPGSRVFGPRFAGSRMGPQLHDFCTSTQYTVRRMFDSRADIRFAICVCFVGDLLVVVGLDSWRQRQRQRQMQNAENCVRAKF